MSFDRCVLRVGALCAILVTTLACTTASDPKANGANSGGAGWSSHAGGAASGGSGGAVVSGGSGGSGGVVASGGSAGTGAGAGAGGMAEPATNPTLRRAVQFSTPSQTFRDSL